MENNYIVITPVKNEEVCLPNLISCMLHQTLKPVTWYIVDDGSNDNTSEIMKKISHQIFWCKLIFLPFRAKRIRGQAVVNAIMTAYDDSLHLNYNYLAKIDADITFNPDLFENLISKMVENPKLGICGPELFTLRNNKWEIDRVLPNEFVRGAIRIYRKSCFISINGLVRRKGWDGIDQIKAKALGWEVERFLNLNSCHSREQGDASGIVKSAIEDGKGSYYMGSRFFYMLLESIQFAKKKPYLVRGFYMIVGYLIGFITQDRINDENVVKYIQKQHKEFLKNKLGLWFFKRHKQP